MKGGTRRYFSALTKRGARLLPFVMALCLLLLSGIAAYSAVTREDRENDPDKQLVRLGLVADFENKYIKIAMAALEQFDYSRYSIVFLPCDENEARRAMKEGETGGYVLFPDDFFDRIAVGDHSPIRFYTEKEETALQLAMTGEVIRGIAQVLLSCENSIYGIQRFILRNGLEADPIAAANVLIAQYFAHAVRRGELFDIEETGVSNAQNYEAYFFDAMLVTALVLFGVCLSPLYTSRRRALQRVLASRGVHGGAQVLCEYGVCLLLTLFCLAILLPTALLSIFLIDRELLTSILPARDTALFFLRACALILPFTSLSCFIYECFDKPVGALLFLIFLALLGGYLSGCFYPSYFFAPALQRVGAYLPAGVALRFLAQPALSDIMILSAYTLLPLGASLLMRRKRLGGDKR